MAHGFAFLVARGRHTGFRTLLAPPFLLEGGQQHVLAEATGAGGSGLDNARIVELDDDAVGRLSVGYTSETVEHADVEAPGERAREPLFDEHGRELEIVYGVVCRDQLLGPLHNEDLQTARTHALTRYRTFLADEDEHAAEPSPAFELRGATRKRPASRPAGAGRDRSGGGSDVSGRRGWSRGPRGILAATIALALAATGTLLVAGGSQPPQVMVYSSLPLRGSEGARSAEIVRGMRLALRRAGGRAGRFHVRYSSLDSSGGRGVWNEQAVAANARRAAADAHASVYIGELDSAASELSIPILSRALLAQISPTNTAAGLTTGEPGASSGEPAKHYVGGFRNYVRIMPRDSVHARALASLARADGCSRVAILRARDDGLASSLARTLSARVMRPVLDVVASRTPGGAAALARSAADRRADCVVFTGGARSAVTIIGSLAQALGPSARLYGTDRLWRRPFMDTFRGELPDRVAVRLKLTLAVAGPDALDAKGLGTANAPQRSRPSRRAPVADASLGYEAMSLALDAIERSRTGGRRDVVEALFHTARRRSVLGTYSINSHGDTTNTDYGVFSIRSGTLFFERRIEPRPRHHE